MTALLSELSVLPKKVHLLCILSLTVKLDDQYIHDLQEKIETSYQKRITDCPTFRWTKAQTWGSGDKNVAICTKLSTLVLPCLCVFSLEQNKGQVIYLWLIFRMKMNDMYMYNQG